MIVCVESFRVFSLSLWRRWGFEALQFVGEVGGGVVDVYLNTSPS